MTGDDKLIDAIIALMRSRWDFPADCNEGEVFAHAEHLLLRIRAGDAKPALIDWANGVQTDKLDMPPSDAAKEIVDHAVALIASGRA
jgi:hypothetical protein